MRKLLAIGLAFMVAAAPLSAQSFLGSYSAWIGPQDLNNSRGVRLWEPSQIIRQDRANFHRFNRRDSGDGGDPWFANANARASLERAVARIAFTPYQRDLIVQGGTWVQLDIYGWNGQQITSVNMQIWR
ncbi:hypothetical protein [Pararhodobacter sp.]|uniref:hypothetical protein n=1 Tax=Pararhodobacter sp. TaxID=2127056 RepID=UPI002AFE15A4|nr:hypothetical protein [Pararhodobacter sp.]